MRVHDGQTYLCMEGPAFSTKAESRMHRQMGGDMIGRTAAPEAKLAREAEMASALIGMPTDYDCWRPHPPQAANVPPPDLLAEMMGNLERATRNNIAVMKGALADVSVVQQQSSPAHTASNLAIWSDKNAVGQTEVERLAPLWGRYFVSG